MFREPSPTEAPKNTITKDPSAATRSSIRRQATIRRPSRYSNANTHEPSQRANFHARLAEEIEREANSLRRRTRSPYSYETTFDLTNSTTDLSRRDAGRRLLRDALRSSHPGRRLRLAREATLNPDRSTSPSFTAELLGRASPGLETTASRHGAEHLPLTPRFAPAVAYHSTVPSQPRPDGLPLSPFPRVDGAVDDAAAPTVPLLRRFGHRSVNEAQRQRREPVVDGLGDRQRSISPDMDHENDAWETLLTTITPDVHLPSADSSFTSASVSGSTDPSRMGASRGTANSSQTLPSSLDSSGAGLSTALDPYPEFLNPCDYPTSSDSETESEPERSTLLRRYPSRLYPTSSERRRAAALGPESTMSSQPPVPTVSFSLQNPSTDPDFQQMHAILDRLARREDIPDDWWAAAGLSRTLSRRLGVGVESPPVDTADGPLLDRS